MKKQIQFHIYFVAIVLLFFSKHVYSQKDFSVTNYTTKNGLPENNVQSIILDKEGYLWTSYGNGVMRFDGRNFRKFFRSGTPYISLYIYKTWGDEMLVIDASGTIYELKDHRQDTLRTGNVNSLNYMTVKGTLPGKEFYLKYTTPHVNKSFDRNWVEPLTIFPSSKTNYLVRTKKGISIYEKYELKDELNLESFSPTHFLKIDKHVYFFSNRNELFLLDIPNRKIERCQLTGDFHTKQFSSGSFTEIINTYWDYNNSEPCIQSGYKLYQLSITGNNPLQIKSELITDRIPDNCLINSLVYNSTLHLLLIATDSKGLFIFKEKKFRNLVYDNPEPGTNNTYYCQLELDSNRIFTEWNREFTKDGGAKSNLPIKRNYSENIFRDRHGSLWYEQERNLIKYNPFKKTYTHIVNPTRQFVLSYFEEGDSIWVGTYNSIGCIRNDTLRLIYRIENNESNSNLFQVFRWTDHRIWFCTYTGIYRFSPENNRIDTLHTLFQKYPYNITIFKGYMMIGTYGRGYYFYKDGKTIRMPEDKNNNLQQVHSFLNDSNGYTWMATNNGLFKTRFDDLVTYFNDSTTDVFFLHYGEDDGIQNPEFNGGCIPSHITLKNGFVSIPSVDGFIWFKPMEVYDAALNAPFRIDAIALDGTMLHETASLIVPTEIQSIRIDFTTAYWGNPENLLSEYKLEGYNKQWIALNSFQSSIEFSNLQPGNYTFNLRKKTGFESKNYIAAKISFNVEKKFYQTTWFILYCFFMAILFVTGVARLYAYNITKTNKLLEKKVRRRTYELSQANKDLQQAVSVKDKLISIISHDIVTPLRFITMVARKGADPEKTMEKENMQAVLEDIKNTSEKLHANAQNILNWIKHQNKRITVSKSNVAMSVLTEEITDMLKEMAGTKGTILLNEISPDDVFITDKNILSIILHNLVSNSIKFTINGTICITAFQQQDKYCIQVKDTGSGMNESQLLRINNILSRQPVSPADPAKGETGYGLGYVIITELLELLQGSLTIESSLGKGTVVRILLK